MRVICGILVTALLASCAETPPSESEFFVGSARVLPGRGMFAVQLTAAAKPDEIVTAARALCAANANCTVMGWREPAQLPGTMPLLDREAAAMAFSYALNRTTGFERALWDCRQIKRAGDECLAQE